MALPREKMPARARATPVVDWDDWTGSIERMRKRFVRFPLPREFLVSLTLSSFRLDDIEVSQGDVAAAAARGAMRRAFRSRQAQRIRNHLAIQQSIESCLRHGRLLAVDDTIRWYTAISCGLSTSPVDGPSLGRLERAVRRMNTPQHRLQAAVQEAAGAYAETVADPIFPGFNGILCRLMLHYQLGRAGLPPVMFDPAVDKAAVADSVQILPRLLERTTATIASLCGNL